MSQSEKELAFVEEYKALLKKYNVALVVSPWSDEWGSHIDVAFKETGRYCNINYSPECIEAPHRNCGH